MDAFLTADGLIALVTLTSQLLGHSVFNYLLDRIRPVVVSLAILLEIPGAALLAAAFLGQVPPPGVFVGLVLILVGMTLVVIEGPDRTDEPGLASSTSSMAAKCDRFGAGSPVACTAATLPAVQNGRSGSNAGCSPNIWSGQSRDPFGTAMVGRAA